MRDFGKGSFSLRQAPRPARLVYGAFVVFAALGFATQLGFVLGRIGVSPVAIAAYYRGGESGDAMTFPKTFGQLLDITHAHAFVMGIVFLVLAHLFLSTSAPARLKAAALVASFAGTFGDLLAPWLVRYGAAWCAWILIVSWAAEAGGYTVILVVTGRECVGPDG